MNLLIYNHSNLHFFCVFLNKVFFYHQQVFYFPYCKMDSIHWIVNNLHSMYTSDDLGQDSPLVKETIKKFIDITAQAENKYKKPSLVNIWRNYASTYLALDSNLKPVTDLAPYFQQDHDFKTLEANIYK